MAILSLKFESDRPSSSFHFDGKNREAILATRIFLSTYFRKTSIQQRAFEYLGEPCVAKRRKCRIDLCSSDDYTYSRYDEIPIEDGTKKILRVDRTEKCRDASFRGNCGNRRDKRITRCSTLCFFYDSVWNLELETDACEKSGGTPSPFLLSLSFLSC